MDEIRPWLFIGSYRDTLNSAYLSANRIQAMLELAEEINQPNIVSLYLQVEDIAPIPQESLRQGVEFIRENKRQEKRILVACGAGINRSSAFCTAALKEEEGLSLLDAFKAIKEQHFDAMPNHLVWESLCSYYHETSPYLAIMRLSI